MHIPRRFRWLFPAALMLALIFVQVGFAGAAPASRFSLVAPGVEVDPAAGEMIESGQAIQVRLSGDAALQGSAQVTALIDNQVVPVEGSGALLTIRVSATLNGGLHRVRLTVPALVGKPREIEWSFQAPAPAEVELHDASVTVTNNAKKATMYEGDTLEVIATAPAGGKATAYQGGFSFALAETSPGQYTASHDIHRTDYSLAMPTRVRVTLPGGQVVGNSSANPVKIFGSMFTVRIDSPANGSKVPYDFVIKGHTRPNARITISPSVGAAVSPAQQSASSAGRPQTIQNVKTGMGGWDIQADSRGKFEQKFGFPLRMFDLSYSFLMTATDSEGQQAIPSTFYVTLTGKKNDGKQPEKSTAPVPAPSPEKTNPDGNGNF